MEDIILVTADSLRADHCGWQGEADLTPNLDDLAADSLVFESAISPGPRTLSSVPVSHTGTHFPADHIDTSNYDDRIARIKSQVERFQTISEYLREEGWTTICFTANPWTSEETGFDAGFDIFTEVGRTSSERIEGIFNGTPLERPGRMLDRWVNNDTWFSQWRTFYDEFVAAIKSADGPVFAWAFLLDTHFPYLVPRHDRYNSTTYEMYSGALQGGRALNATGERNVLSNSMDNRLHKKVTRSYRDCVMSIDTFVGQLKGEVSDDTILIFHSDHGEAFGEHGTYGHEPQLYDENIHVPLLVTGMDENQSVSQPISTAAIPELLQTYVSRGTIDPSDHTDDFVAAKTEDSNKVAIRGEKYKLVRTDSSEMLFDIKKDPGETTDLSKERPEKLSTMREICRNYIDRLPEPEEQVSYTESESMKDNLRSLGYLQDK